MEAQEDFTGSSWHLVKMIPMTPEPKAWISFVCNRSPESRVPWILGAMPSLTSITILGQGPVSPATEICLGI